MPQNEYISTMPSGPSMPGLPTVPVALSQAVGSDRFAQGHSDSAVSSKQAVAQGARKRHGSKAWVIVSGVVMAAFTVFVLLDTFAIQRVVQQVSAPDTASIASSAELSQQTDQGADGLEEMLTGLEQSGQSKTGNIVYTEHKSATAQDASSTEGAATGQTNDEAAGVALTGDENPDGNSISSQDGDQTVSAATSADYSYSDENMQISISKSRINDTDVFVADIQVSSAEYLKTALAQNAYGRNLKDTTSNMAQSAGAVLAINGDYYGFRDDGYVLRNGVLYRDAASANTDALVVYGDGSMAAANQSATSAQELLDAGAWQVLSFGPVLVSEGEVAVSQGQEVGQSMNSNPRTAIGMVEPLHYVVVVSDGRSSSNAGLSLYDLAQVMTDAGATFAYNLDGGGSTTLWFQGEVLNDPSSGHRSGEREVSDIVYFG